MTPNDFDRHFERASKDIDRMHRLLPIFAILSAIVIVLLIVVLGLGAYWLWGVVAG